MLKYFVLLAGFGLLISNTYSSMYMKTVNINCTGSKKYIFQNYSCRLKAINRFKSVGMLQLVVRMSLRNISFNLGVFIRNDANIFKPFIVNITENMCRWYDQQNPSPYAAIAKKVLKEFTNINHSCPLTGTLTGTNLYLGLSIIPVPLPKYSYKINVIFYEGIQNLYDFVGTLTLYMDLIEKIKR